MVRPKKGEPGVNTFPRSGKTYRSGKVDASPLCMKLNFGANPLLITDKAGTAITAKGPAVMNAAAGATVNIMVWGDISEWYGANERDVYWALKNRNVSQINVYIASMGGEMYQAILMYEMLKAHPANVTAYLVGMCASSATLVACAANEVVMSEQCLYMVHKPALGTWGDANDLRASADMLDQYQGIAVRVYKKKTGLEDDQINALMNNESWLEPDAALFLGFVDRIVPNIDVDFLLPETETTNASYDHHYYDDIFNATTAYRVTASAYMQAGFRPAHKSDVESLLTETVSNTSPKHKTMTKEFFNKILNFINGKGGVTTENADSLAEQMAADQTLTSDLDQVAMTAVAERVVSAKIPTAPVLTAAGLLKVLNEATPEQKAAVTALIAPAIESGENAGDEDENDATAKRLEELEGEIAMLKKGGAVINSSNGKVPGKKEAKTADVSEKQKVQNALALSWYQNGSLSAADYTKQTGLEAPARS